jgi:hypothetical protein
MVSLNRVLMKLSIHKHQDADGKMHVPGLRVEVVNDVDEVAKVSSPKHLWTT